MSDEPMPVGKAGQVRVADSTPRGWHWADPPPQTAFSGTTASLLEAAIATGNWAEWVAALRAIRIDRGILVDGRKP